MNEDAVAVLQQHDGSNPNGTSLNGTSLYGTSLTGIALLGSNPNGGSLGVAATGAPLSGADVVGSTWPGHLADGSPVVLRIDGAIQGKGANADVWSYLVSASVDDTWHALCPPSAAGEPVYADSVRGTWNVAQGVPGGGSYDPDAPEFTLACRGSSIAKCVELGYKPWSGYARELAACVRALRADYCGDGTPYTVDGTLIDLYDDAGILSDSLAWNPEAEWTPDGATCISRTTETRFWQVASERPWCFPHALKPKNSCGTGFSGGATIITELAPR
ncbi:MAG TPA: ADYC domain-containing protein [Kofleriaceae bacterium]|nr:ADYC domain-containing protein [Kofleriaceae bacterium]